MICDGKSPALGAGAWIHPCRVALAFLAVAVLLAGCCGGGGDDRAKVEDTLQNSLNHLDPVVRAALLVGAGPPRVKGNSCKRTAPPPRRPILPARLPKGFVRPPRPPKHLAYWSCVVSFARTPFHLRVALKDNGKIFWAMLMPRQVLRPGTATVYEGGPKQPKP
jgi:hypothetical protein